MYLFILIALLIIVELYYWFVYFPRALKDGSNREINELKNGIRFMRRFYRGE